MTRLEIKYCLAEEIKGIIAQFLRKSIIISLPTLKINFAGDTPLLT